MRLLFWMVAICAAQTSAAQKQPPAFGKISIADLQLNDCSFDEGAAAFKLLDIGSLYYTRNFSGGFPFTAMYERRVRVKILKEPGLVYANVSIPVYTYNNT